MGGCKMTSSLLLLIHLLLVMFGEALGEIDHEIKSKEIELINNHMEEDDDPIIKMVTQMDQDDENSSQQEHHHSHLDHINPSLKVFFTMNDLKQGKKLPIYFPKRDPSKSPPFLPKEEADSIPFSLKKLPQILSFFSFPSASPQAQAVKETLQQCELKPIMGETKFCATSMESMLDFVATALGGAPKSSPKLLTTSHDLNRHSNVRFQNYTFVGAPKEIAAPRLVACHTMPYPYAVYYCHFQEADNSVLKIPLEGENGDRVDALAVCHLDTSQWSSSHPAFRVLKIEPGTIPVCHFFPADDFEWIPVAA